MNQSVAQTIADDLQAVVLSAAGSEDVSIRKMLQVVAERFDAFGCGLWEESPFTIQTEGKKAEPKSLITIAAWWRNGERFATDDVPMDGSPTAAAMRKGQADSVDDIQGREHGSLEHYERFWERNDVHPMCVAPVIFLDNSRGAINVYRSGRKVFTDDEKDRLTAIACLIPGLYRAVRESTELKLVKDVGLLLQHQKADLRRAKPSKQGQELTAKDVKELLREVCVDVAAAFSCVEVSIFLEDRNRASCYSLAATSDARCVKQSEYLMTNHTASLTEHVLHSSFEVTVPDMTKIYNYQEWLKATYGFESLAPIERYTDHARKVLHLKKTDYLPPMTFAALPIFGDAEWFFGTNLCGVIRCYGAQQGPYYFEDRDIEVLRVVAQLVGKWWVAWRTRTELKQENKTWKKLAVELDRMNLHTLQVLKDPKGSRDAILEEGLRVAESVFEDAELNGYRLINDAGNNLIFEKFGKKAQEQLCDAVKVKTSPDTFPIRDKSRWGWKVYKSGEVFVRRDLQSKPPRDYVPIFAETTGIVIAPIGVGEKRFGVLDLRWTKYDIPPFASTAAMLIGQQIGVCLHLLEIVGEMRRMQRHAEDAELLQKRIYEDFSHQLKSPIRVAKLRVEEAVRAYAGTQAPRALLVARGLVRRAHRVAANMRTLTMISKGEPLELKRMPVETSLLVKSLSEIANDTMFQYANGVSFAVDSASILKLALKDYGFDRDSFEHCITNLLDNAAKYSRPGTVVKIIGGVDSSARFYIAVANQGIPILPHEINKIATRTWQSSYAKGLGLDGQGIGLWLTKELLRPQGGELIVIPRNAEGLTEFRIAFARITAHLNS